MDALRLKELSELSQEDEDHQLQFESECALAGFGETSDDEAFLDWVERKAELYLSDNESQERNEEELDRIEKQLDF